MASTLEQISPYAEALLDDYIYDELDDAGKKLRAAYNRVSRRKQIDDPRAVRLVREAAESIRNAAQAVGRAEPEPPHRMRRVFLALVITGATVWVVKQLAE